MKRSVLQSVRLLVLAVVVGLSGCVSSGVDPELQDLDPFDEAATNVIVFGDWGRNGFFGQRDVAEAMGNFAAENAVDFIISTGDNFYNSGVESVDDGQWERSFERIYTAPSLYVPWFPVLGNHDVRGSVEAQIAYSAKSDRWTMPDEYYTYAQTVIDTTEVLFVFLETTSLVEGDSLTAAHPQLRWLDAVLTESEAEWKIVVGHHPIYSSDAKHDSPEDLIEHLKPILVRHGVQAYLAGHAHNLQHHVPGDGIHYFVSGAGSLLRDVQREPFTRFAQEEKGFLALSITRDLMQTRFIDDRGRTLHVADIPLGETEPTAEPVPAGVE